MARRAAYLFADGGRPGCPAYAVFEAVEACTARELVASLGLSKAAVARVCSQGKVAALGADGLPEAASLAPQDLLSPGARVALLLGAPCTEGLAGEGGPDPVRILYEDPFALAVDKPAGLLVHGDGTGAPTLTDRVRSLLARRGAGAFPQAVQRLDVETTGIVLFSKYAELQPLFDGLVSSGGMEKRYLAVVRGAFPRGRRTFTDPIARDRHDARRMRAARQGGQEALTEVERLAVSPDGARSLLAVRLGTGRRHQIRVHLAAHGYPIVNDPLYGTVEDRRGLMLHAWAERFIHPVTGARVGIDAGWPERFSAWFDPATLTGLTGAGPCAGEAPHGA